ncbi:protein SPATA45 homolog [Styela clava]|uniref:protein SPATA45 homolog n=1 Tax=Styela clava TaxID=7725 RepID=UPI00193A7EA5|nr:protein SPATA45 homolog [Styela clava]
MNQEMLYQLGNSRESWCAVELNKSQDWCRSERRHSKENFVSTVFNPTVNTDSEPRCQWKIDAPTHREKRHFSFANANQLK